MHLVPGEDVVLQRTTLQSTLAVDTQRSSWSSVSSGPGARRCSYTSWWLLCTLWIGRKATVLVWGGWNRVCLVRSAGSGEHRETLKKPMLLAPVVQRKECMFLTIQQATSGTLISARWSEPCQNRSFLLVLRGTRWLMLRQSWGVSSIYAMWMFKATGQWNESGAKLLLTRADGLLLSAANIFWVKGSICENIYWNSAFGISGG